MVSARRTCCVPCNVSWPTTPGTRPSDKPSTARPASKPWTDAARDPQPRLPFLPRQSPRQPLLTRKPARRRRSLFPHRPLTAVATTGDAAAAVATSQLPQKPRHQRHRSASHRRQVRTCRDLRLHRRHRCRRLHRLRWLPHCRRHLSSRSRRRAWCSRGPNRAPRCALSIGTRYPRTRCSPAAARACGGASPRATPEGNPRSTSRTSRVCSVSTSHRSPRPRHTTPQALQEPVPTPDGQEAAEVRAAAAKAADHVILHPVVRETKHRSGYSTRRGACRWASS